MAQKRFQIPFCILVLLLILTIIPGVNSLLDNETSQIAIKQNQTAIVPTISDVGLNSTVVSQTSAPGQNGSKDIVLTQGMNNSGMVRPLPQSTGLGSGISSSGGAETDSQISQLLLLKM